MIIWGSRGREIEQRSGQFHCPQCDNEQEYRLYRVATYFTLYFIPLFETEHHGNYVKCGGCRGQYKPEVLDYKPPSAAERMILSVRADLESGTPVEMTRTKLVNAGLQENTADEVVALAAGDDRLRCAACNLSFVRSVPRCAACGGGLSGG
ncbi:zinc-ribbon domain-containing protein [bacterium]|nr:zinc-ribbon domain-containing protein [bacterium]